MVGAAGFEPATPASRTELLPKEPLNFQHFLSPFRTDLRRLFPLFFGGCSGGSGFRQRRPTSILWIALHCDEETSIDSAILSMGPI